MPPSCGERPKPVVEAIKERFTTSEQNQSVLTPSVPHTPAPPLSLQLGAPTALDFSRGSFQIQSPSPSPPLHHHHHSLRSGERDTSFMTSIFLDVSV